MREIKFRCWDKEHKKFKYDFFLYLEGDLYLDGGYDAPYDIHDRSRYVLNQYTGLRDNLGKYIYEGDIVKCYEHKESFVGVVEFMHGMFGFREKDSDFIELACWVTSLDILGNIYENPELLENKYCQELEDIDINERPKIILNNTN